MIRAGLCAWRSFFSTFRGIASRGWACAILFFAIYVTSAGLPFLSLSASPDLRPPAEKIGIDYSFLGKRIDLDLEFTDEHGKTVRLGELSRGKPIVLALVYYKCRGICSPFLNAVAHMVETSPVYFLPGNDYTLVTLSFDENEDFQLASEKKQAYIANLSNPNRFDTSRWYFLTGSKENIHKLTDSLGFYFKRDPLQGFKHPSSLIVISPSGLISRYMRGLNFLPTELMVAVTDAREDKWAPTVQKIVKLCFVKDPEGRGYYFDFLKVTGILVLLAIFGGIALLSVFFRIKERGSK